MNDNAPKPGPPNNQTRTGFVTIEAAYSCEAYRFGKMIRYMAQQGKGVGSNTQFGVITVKVFDEHGNEIGKDTTNPDGDKAEAKRLEDLLEERIFGDDLDGAA